MPTDPPPPAPGARMVYADACDGLDPELYAVTVIEWPAFPPAEPGMSFVMATGRDVYPPGGIFAVYGDAAFVENRHLFPAADDAKRRLRELASERVRQARDTLDRIDEMEVR